MTGTNIYDRQPGSSSGHMRALCGPGVSSTQAGSGSADGLAGETEGIL